VKIGLAIIEIRPGDCSTVEYLKDASRGKVPDLPANIRLGWKSSLGTNALAY
jgi:hypothetical protein